MVTKHYIPVEIRERVYHRACLLSYWHVTDPLRVKLHAQYSARSKKAMSHEILQRPIYIYSLSWLLCMTVCGIQWSMQNSLDVSRSSHVNCTMEYH